MNYARLPSGDWIDLDDDERTPPWYDPDAIHDRRMTAERDPRRYLRTTSSPEGTE